MSETTRAPGLLPRPAIMWIVLIGVAAVFALCGGEISAQQPHAGKAPYDKWCAGCHGDTGAGDGSAAAYMLPRPRDFTRGAYQIRTSAELPTDADIKRVIDEGMPGTAMPGWSEKLTERERDDLVGYLKTFSPFFANARPTALEIRAPGGGDEAIASGRQVYQTLECFKCHGASGRGDGMSAPTLTDDWDQPIRAADLTRAWRFNGGSSVEQIYTRLQTGLTGTPMPSFADAVGQGVITQEQLGHLAQYVRSLSPERDPEVREVVRAVRATAALPAGPTDSAWATVEEQYIPLVGQIIVKPRWFAPMVEGVWVAAIHDGERVTLRLRWSDPSKSPDAPWNEWHGRMRTAMIDADSVPFAPHGPDLMTVQFPTQIGDAERPFFLGGTNRRPVYLWRWSSNPDRSEEARGTKLGTATARAGATQLTHSAAFADGEWRLQLSRPIASSDSAAAPSFPVGQAIPIAFFAADGSSGEDAVRSSVSTWYALYLDVPTEPRVYAVPLVAMALTAGLGAVAVRNAQRGRRKPKRSTSEEK